MSLSSYKITDTAIAQKGVIAAPDKLTGTAAQNKAVFDRLIRESVKELFNSLIDALSGTGGAGEIGTRAISGVTGGDVQTALGSLKTILDTKAASSTMTSALSLKSDKSVTNLHIKSVSLNANTGVFTFTREDGSYFTIDTVLEKVATNWSYNASTQSLVLTLADGTTQSVPLSAFITETEFQDSAQIAFSVSNHKVTATVKEGGITDAMLSSALVSQLQGYVTAAAGSATAAAQSATAAEGYKTTASQKAADAAQSEANAAASAAAAGSSETVSGQKAAAAASSEQNAAASKSAAASSAQLAESYTHGGTGVRAGEDTDNALYYKNQAAAIVGGDYATNIDLANAVSAHNSSVTAHGDIREALETKADASALTTHTGNGDIHVTAAQKTAWNGKADASALTTHTGNSNIHVTAAQKTTWNNKQNALTFDSAPTSGSANPVTSGGVYTAIRNAEKKPYVRTFTAANWSNGAITIAAATHGFTGSGVVAQFYHLVSGSYVAGTWACVESWAEIDASSHVITLHGPSTGYAGKVVLYG